MLKKHMFRYVFTFNKSLYSAICMMLLVMSVLFFSLIFMNNSYATLQQNYKSLAQEDFQFYPLTDPLTSNSADITYLEQQYKFKSELLKYKLAEKEGIYYKIIKPTTHINKPYFVSGGQAKTDDEVIIDSNSAKRLKLSVNDSYTFLDNVYRISGIASFPGQVQPNMSLTGYKLYNAEQSILLSFSDNVYQHLQFDEKVTYGAVFEDSLQELDQEHFSFLQLSKDNHELNALTVKLTMNQMIAGLSTGVLSTIILIMMMMLIYKMVKDNEKYIGVLKGIGYSNKAIIRAFVPFLLTFSIPIIIGFLISFLIKESLYNFMNQDLIAPYIIDNYSVIILLIAIVVFLAVIITQAIVMLLFMLRKAPIKLIQNINDSKLSRVRVKLLDVFNKLSGIRKLQIKYLLSYPFILVLTLFSGFALAVQIMLAFAIYEFPNKLVEGVKQQFTYSYDVRLNEPAALPEHEAYTSYMVTEGAIESHGVRLPFDLFIVQKPELQSLFVLKSYEEKGHASITSLLNNGVIISKWSANKYSLSVGDIVTLSINNEDHEMAIAGVHKGLQGSEMYTSARYYEKITNNRVLIVDGFFTNESEPSMLVNTPIKSVTNQHEIIKSAEQRVEQYKAISLALLMIGIVIGTILFAIALYIVIQNGQKHMLLLKALGYTNKQVFTIVMNGYVFILLLGVVIARPYLSLLTTFLFDIISKESSFYLPIESRLLHLIYLVLGVLLFFNFISFFYKRKITSMTNFSTLMDE